MGEMTFRGVPMNLLSWMMIKLVYFYQKHASQSLRNSCRFEPSCSNYMILSIKKYGSIKGLYKGLLRISRCKIPNSGIDYP